MPAQTELVSAADGAARPNFEVGDRARLLHGSAGDAARWWTVEAVDERFIVLTRQADFKKKGVHLYTIIDWVRGVRGPCDLIGQGWDVDVPGGSDQLLRALNAFFEPRETPPSGEWMVAERRVQVSHRNNVEIGFAALDLLADRRTPQLGDPVTFTNVLHRVFGAKGERTWKEWEWPEAERTGILTGIRTLSNGVADYNFDDPTTYEVSDTFTAYIVTFDLRRKPVLVRPERLTVPPTTKAVA